MKRANANLDTAGLPPLADALTSRGLRKTFASVLPALEAPSRVVVAETGHTTERAA